MGKLVVTEFMSVDGVFEDPGGSEDFEHGGWTFEYDRGDDGNKFKLDELMDADVQLLGRVTYEGFAAAWPEREGDFADKFNTMDKVVVSTSLQDPAWSGTTVVRDLDGVRALKEGDGGPIQVAGSPTLAQSLHRAGLVDRWNLMVFPVVLGSGKRLFPTDAEDKQKLTLRESRSYTNGVQLNVFDVVR